MIPYIRIKKDKVRAAYLKNNSTSLPSNVDYVRATIFRVMEKIDRPISVDEYLMLARRYAHMVSANHGNTLKPFYNHVSCGSLYGEAGRFIIDGDCISREISLSRSNCLDYSGYNDNKFCLISDKERLVRKIEASVKQCRNMLWQDYYCHPKRSKFISWFIHCACCGKLEKKSTMWCSDKCRSCSAKTAHYERNKKEAVEVNRLLNKLKKVIRNESKRLKKEIS